MSRGKSPQSKNRLNKPRVIQNNQLPALPARKGPRNYLDLGLSLPFREEMKKDDRAKSRMSIDRSKEQISIYLANQRGYEGDFGSAEFNESQRKQLVDHLQQVICNKDIKDIPTIYTDKGQVRLRSSGSGIVELEIKNPSDSCSYSLSAVELLHLKMLVS